MREDDFHATPANTILQANGLPCTYVSKETKKCSIVASVYYDNAGYGLIAAGAGMAHECGDHVRVFQGGVSRRPAQAGVRHSANHAVAFNLDET